MFQPCKGCGSIPGHVIPQRNRAGLQKPLEKSTPQRRCLHGLVKRDIKQEMSGQSHQGDKGRAVIGYLDRQEAESRRKRTQGQTEGLEPEGHQVASVSHGPELCREWREAGSQWKQSPMCRRALCPCRALFPWMCFSFRLYS